jgi:hypothetical protein
VWNPSKPEELLQKSTPSVEILPIYDTPPHCSRLALLVDSIPHQERMGSTLCCQPGTKKLTVAEGQPPFDVQRGEIR